MHSHDRTGLQRLWGVTVLTLAKIWPFARLGPINRVNVVDDVVLLEKFQMGIFTEVLHAEVDGQPVKDVETFNHHPAEGFSHSFSEHYDAVAQVREVLGTLRGMTQLAALAKGVRQLAASPLLDFYLQGYALPKVQTPQDVDVLQVQDREVGFELSGGVSLMALVSQVQGGNVSALRALLRKTRPTPQTLSWGFEVTMQAGRVVGVEIPEAFGDPRRIAGLFAHAEFLAGKKYDEAALEGFTKVLQVHPVAAAYLNRGNVYLQRDQYDLAIADYTKALALNPRYAEAYNNRAVAYSQWKGQHDLAIADATKAVKFNPRDADAYINRGNAYMGKGQDDLAIADYTKALELNPRYAEAYMSKASVCERVGRKQEALAAYRGVIEAASPPKDSFIEYARKRIQALETAVDVSGTVFCNGGFPIVIAKFWGLRNVDSRLPQRS